MRPSLSEKQPRPVSPPSSLHEAHWPLCLPAVGIVPPRTKSPAEEEVTPAGVVRRNANGLPNGLSARVSVLAGSGGLAGLSQARSPGALSVHHLPLLFEKPRAGGGRQNKQEGQQPQPRGCPSRRRAKGQECVHNKDKESTEQNYDDETQMWQKPVVRVVRWPEQCVRVLGPLGRSRMARSW